MIKTIREVSDQNQKMIYEIIKESTGKNDYNTLYGYQIKKLFVLESLVHYAIGYNNNEIVAVAIDECGNKIGALMSFKNGDTYKVNWYGKVVLQNNQSKLKLNVPAFVSSAPDIKQIKINQTKAKGSFIEFVNNMI